MKHLSKLPAAFALAILVAGAPSASAGIPVPPGMEDNYGGEPTFQYRCTTGYPRMCYWDIGEDNCEKASAMVAAAGAAAGGKLGRWIAGGALSMMMSCGPRPEWWDDAAAEDDEDEEEDRGQSDADDDDREEDDDDE